MAAKWNSHVMTLVYRAKHKILRELPDTSAEMVDAVIEEAIAAACTGRNRQYRGQVKDALREMGFAVMVESWRLP